MPTICGSPVRPTWDSLTDKRQDGNEEEIESDSYILEDDAGTCYWTVQRVCVRGRKPIFKDLFPYPVLPRMG